MTVKLPYNDLEKKIIELEKIISNQKKTTSISLEDVKLYKVLIDALPGMAILLRPSGEVLISNKAGRDMDAFPGKKCYSTWAQKGERCPWCLAPDALSTMEGQRLEIQTRGTVWDVYWIPIQSDLYLHWAVDLKEKKKLETIKQHASEMDTIRPFASNIVHDFNNILGTITGYVEKARHDIGEEESVIHSLDQIVEATKRSKELTKQILSYSGHEKKEARLIDIREIFDNVLKHLETSLLPGVKIQKNLSVKSSMVMADPNQISLLLTNLCTNALNAMKEKGGVLEVLLESMDQITPHGRKPDDYLKITVKDTGCGIESGIIDRIFEPYFTTMERGEGYGLGLSIVRKIVNKYKGTIAIVSEPGMGTTVEVLLPKSDDKNASEKQKTEEIIGGTEQILFVDDDRSLTSLGKYNLENLGYKVESITNPIKAMDLFRRDPEKYQLVITDMSMPNMTGEMFARGIMQIKPDVPIILCTGFSELISEEKAISIGIKEFLMKPISLYDLAKAIRTALDEKQ